MAVEFQRISFTLLVKGYLLVKRAFKTLALKMQDAVKLTNIYQRQEESNFRVAIHM